MLGAITAYAVVVGGGLQLADIVVHALDLPAWSLRALIWIAALGLPITAAISWFWDLTRHGFVRTVVPTSRPTPTQATSAETSRYAQSAAALQALGPGGTLAGRYKIERELGAGGMGRVLAAEDLRLGRRVAIKIVTGAHEPSRIRRFEQEARTAGSLEHPNVVAIYDLGEQDGVPFLVTELLDGHTLRTVIESGPLPPEQGHGLALQLARGLAAAHASGIIHRDLKPENLFLTRDGRLKILDFGMAKLLGPDEPKAGEGLTLTGVLFGSPGYISPEQARGEKPNAASDVFSAGAVLYELLSGQRAFPGRSLVEAGHAAITVTPPPLPDAVPKRLSEIVFRALEKEPRKRFRDGGELLRALDQVSGVHPEPVSPRRRGVRVSSAVMVAITVLALGAAVVSAVFVHPHAVAPVRPASPQPTTATREPVSPDGASESVPPAPAAPPAVSIPAVPGLNIPNPPGMSAKDVEELRQLAQQGQGVPVAASLGIITGAHAVEAAGQRDRAIAMLQRSLQKSPSDARVGLELAALLRRNGKRSQATRELAQLARSLNSEEWLAPVVRAWTGEISDDQAVANASAGGEDADARAARNGTAYYYLGLKHETDQPPDLKTAREDYERAADVEEAPESHFAAQALERLGAGGDSSPQ